MRGHLRERRNLRDRGLNTINIWTSGSLTSGLVLSGVLVVTFASASPGHAGQPSSVTAAAPPVAPGAERRTPVPSPIAVPRATREHHKPHATHTATTTTQPAQPALQPPPQPIQPAPAPSHTRSGGS